MPGIVNYENPKLREQLAGEYVLGTLKGRARRRFARLLRDDPAMREAVEAWERRLTPLIEAVPPVTPPKRVWEEIERRVAPPARDTVRARVAFWRPAALLAGAAALVLAVYVYFAPTSSAPAYVAVLNDQQSQPAWLVSAADVTRFTVKALKPPPQAADHAYELWLLPGGDKPPRSLGLLPAEGEKTVTVPAELREMLAAGKTLAVSVEPPGGSPTGLPTGPVLYQGVWLRTG
ncbi:MAG: anti-sigma factor domain-containing protein [Sulfurifustis sp.]